MELQINHFWISMINTAKQKDEFIWLFFVMINVLEANIFQYDFLEEPNGWQNNRYWSSTRWNVAVIKPDLVITNDEMLVAVWLYQL